MICEKCNVEHQGEVCPNCSPQPEEVITPGETVVIDQANTTQNAGLMGKVNDIKNKFGVKKLAIMGLAALLAVIIIIVGFTALFSRLPYQLISFGRYNSIMPISLDGDRFVIDGSEIIDLRGNSIVGYNDYDSFVDIYDGYVLASRGQNRHYLISTSNGRVRANFDRFRSISFITSDRFEVEVGSRIGVIDRRGREIIEPGNFSSIRDFDNASWYVITNDSGNRGLFNARGNQVFSFGEYDTILPISGNRFIVTRGDRIAVVNARGNERIEFGDFADIRYAGNAGFAVEARNGNWGAVNQRGNEIINSRYDSVAWTGAESNMFIARVENRVTVYNHRGNVVVSSGTYDEVRALDNGTLAVRQDSYWGVLNSNGRSIIDTRFSSIQSAEDVGFFVHLDGDVGMYNMRGNEIVPLGSYDRITPIGPGYFLVEEGNAVGAIDSRGNEIIRVGRYSEIHIIVNGFAVVSHDREVGLINTARNPR